MALVKTVGEKEERDLWQKRFTSTSLFPFRVAWSEICFPLMKKTVSFRIPYSGLRMASKQRPWRLANLIYFTDRFMQTIDAFQPAKQMANEI